MRKEKKSGCCGETRRCQREEHSAFAPVEQKDYDCKKREHLYLNDRCNRHRRDKRGVAEVVEFFEVDRLNRYSAWKWQKNPRERCKSGQTEGLEEGQLQIVSPGQNPELPAQHECTRQFADKEQDHGNRGQRRNQPEVVPVAVEIPPPQHENGHQQHKRDGAANSHV